METIMRPRGSDSPVSATPRQNRAAREARKGPRIPGHARRFWERADDALSADGGLPRLYEARCEATASPFGEDAAVWLDPDPVCVLVVWRDGSAAVVPRHLGDFIVSELRAHPLPIQGERKTGNAGI